MEGEPGMSGTVKILEMTINGHPYTCPECGAPGFTLDGGRWDGMPADANCDYSHHWTDALITAGTLTMIRGSRSGRTKATHDDTFSVTVGGAHLAGTLQPEIVYDDVRQGGKAFWYRGLKPTLRKKKRAAVRTVTAPGKKAARTAKAAARDMVATGKSAALAAAWDIQAGGHEPDPDYEPEPVIPCGAGCTRGYFELDTRIHGTTKVVCTACHGTGETP
jgi:hypothetical protein